jgi:hypothetical protein
MGTAVIVLAFLCAGVAVWNFVVGMWIMGIIDLAFAVWFFVKFMEDF